MAISVFLVDDHTVVRDGLRFLLEAQGDIKVVGNANDGRDAVRQVSILKPDVVVMDIAMPELNGIEATLQIQKKCPSARVVILSMHSTAEHIRQALQAGAQGYVLKKSAGEEVVEAVRAVNAGRGYLSKAIAGIVIDDYKYLKPAPSPLENLTRRERQILQLIAEGKSNTEAAQILFLSPKTVETYRSRMMQKLGISNLRGLMKFAVQHGLTSLE